MNDPETGLSLAMKLGLGKPYEDVVPDKKFTFKEGTYEAFYSCRESIFTCLRIRYRSFTNSGTALPQSADLAYHPQCCRLYHGHQCKGYLR